jgi:hypothetical protein
MGIQIFKAFMQAFSRNQNRTFKKSEALRKYKERSSRLSRNNPMLKKGRISIINGPIIVLTPCPTPKRWGERAG